MQYLFPADKGSFPFSTHIVCIEVQVYEFNLFSFFPTKDDNITFEMTMTASGPLSLCIIKYCGDIRAPAAKQYFSKHIMHKNEVTCWFVSLTVLLSAALSFTSTCIYSILLWFLLCPQTLLTFRTISPVPLQKIPSPAAISWYHMSGASSTDIQKFPLFHRAVLGI